MQRNRYTLPARRFRPGDNGNRLAMPVRHEVARLLYEARGSAPGREDIVSKPTTDTNLEAQQDLLPPIEWTTRLHNDIDSAQGCEVGAEFDRNVDSAIENAESILAELRAARP